MRKISRPHTSLVFYLIKFVFPPIRPFIAHETKTTDLTDDAEEKKVGIMRNKINILKQNSLLSGICIRMLVLGLGIVVLGWQWVLSLMLGYKLIKLGFKLIGLAFNVLWTILSFLILIGLILLLIF